MNLHMTALGVFVFIALIVVVVSFVGGIFGLTPSWVAADHSIPAVAVGDAPNVVTVFDTIWDAILFYGGMITFSILGVPGELSVIWIFLNIIGILAIAVFVRSG